MSRRLAGTVGLIALLLGVAPGVASAQYATKDSGASREAKAFAERIDKIINRRLATEKIPPGPRAVEATLARRLHIDLIGKIPDLTEITNFLDDDDDTKYLKRIDYLLEHPAFINNWANYYRSVMLSGSNNQQAQQFQFQFEGWLRNKLSSNTPYDKMAHEVITSQPNVGGITPAAFFQVNENKAENLAGATAKVFLGVKIECAQCHKHPFAKWTRNQFWEYAAFFAGVNRPPNQPIQKGGQPFDPNIRQIKIPETDTVVQAKFITGDAPNWQANSNPRLVLADWMTSRDNPFFAKAAVDHVWQYFFGSSLVEPVFEPTDDSPPPQEDLLDELARSFIASGYDLKFLIKAIVLTDAYQRASVALNVDSKEHITYFARMPVRGMMPEQLYDSFIVATATSAEKNALNDPYMPQVQQFNQPNSPRQQFLSKFTSQDKRIETQTSILQALYLMNGKFLADRTKLDQNESLQQLLRQNTDTARKVRTLYLLTLSRTPSSDEMAKMTRYIESGGGAGDPGQALSDVCWALLNCSEFLLNH